MTPHFDKWNLTFCLFAVCFATIGMLEGLHAQTKSQPLPEIEFLRIQHLIDQSKNNAKDALIIRTSFEANQAEGKRLADKLDAQIDDTCKAHGFNPPCQLLYDGLPPEAACKAHRLNPGCDLSAFAVSIGEMGGAPAQAARPKPGEPPAPSRRPAAKPAAPVKP